LDPTNNKIACHSGGQDAAPRGKQAFEAGDAVQR
jgi:hypothetical protein